MPQPSPLGPLGRRSLLLGGAAAGSALLLPARSAATPFLARSGRPVLTDGIQSGDVAASAAVVWARADRIARMYVDISPTETFRKVRRVRGPLLDTRNDLTGKTLLRGLPAGQDVHYRVVLADPDDDSVTGEPQVGRLRTAPVGSSDIRFVWSADLGGQGWGINPSRGGYRIFESMRRLNPDFFLCSGDLIYADGVIPSEKPLSDGTVWRNLVTPAKSMFITWADSRRWVRVTT